MTLILLDTNVLSELLQPSPNRAVVAWMNQRFPVCAVSAVSIFELNAGVAMLARGKRREALESGIARIIRRFGARVYSFDPPAALAAVRLLELVRAKGLALHQRDKLADLQLAGIASAYGLELATRDVADFKGTGLTLINPWEASA